MGSGFDSGLASAFASAAPSCFASAFAASVGLSFAFAVSGLRFFAASPASLKYCSSSCLGNDSSERSRKTYHASISSFVRSLRKASTLPSAEKRGRPSLSGWRVMLTAGLERSLGTIQRSLLKSMSDCAKQIAVESGLHTNSMPESHPGCTVVTAFVARSSMQSSPWLRRKSNRVPSGLGTIWRSCAGSCSSAVTSNATASGQRFGSSFFSSGFFSSFLSAGLASSLGASGLAGSAAFAGSAAGSTGLAGSGLAGSAVGSAGLGSAALGSAAAGSVGFGSAGAAAGSAGLAPSAGAGSAGLGCSMGLVAASKLFFTSSRVFVTVACQRSSVPAWSLVK